MQSVLKKAGYIDSSLEQSMQMTSTPMQNEGGGEKDDEFQLYEDSQHQ